MNSRKVELKNVKSGDVFYECERGQNMEMKALEDARRIRRGKNMHVPGKYVQDGYICKVQTVEGEIELYEHIEPGGYGLRLYTSPQYI